MWCSLNQSSVQVVFIYLHVLDININFFTLAFWSFPEIPATLNGLHTLKVHYVNELPLYMIKIRYKMSMSHRAYHTKYQISSAGWCKI